MKFEFEVNKEKETMDVYFEGKLIASLDEDDAEDFVLAVKTAKTRFEHATYEYERVGVEELTDAAENSESSDVLDIKGIYMQVLKNAKNNEVETEVNIMFSNQDEQIVNVDLSENFKEEQVFFGEATNHDIRNCFNGDVLEFLKENKDIEIWFNDQLVELNELFDEEETHWYDFGESGSNR